MSRIGKTPIKIPSQVKIDLAETKLSVTGPKGALEFSLPQPIRVRQQNEELMVESQGNLRSDRALYGLVRATVANMIKGVDEGFKKELELFGVGYRVQVEGDTLNLMIGFSHPVKFKAPAGIKFAVSENRIIIEGADKQLVGEMASQIRRLKPPEPYKGKGIKYVGEKIRRKAGKAAKTVGGSK